MSTQIGVPVSHPVPRSSSRCAEVRSQRPSRPSHPSVVTAVFGAGRGAAGPGRAGGVRDRSAPPGAAAAHLGILKGCGFFFTFPQCHDFRFPPSKKKKKQPRAERPAARGRSHGGAGGQRGASAARAALAAAAAGIPVLP